MAKNDNPVIERFNARSSFARDIIGCSLLITIARFLIWYGGEKGRETGEPGLLKREIFLLSIIYKLVVK